MLRIQQSLTLFSPMFPPNTIKYGLVYEKVCPYRFPGVLCDTLITFQTPTPSLMSKWYKSSEARPPEPVAPPKITILYGSMQTAPCAARADGEVPDAKLMKNYFRLFSRTGWRGRECKYCLWWRTARWFRWRLQRDRFFLQRREWCYDQSGGAGRFRRLLVFKKTWGIQI